MFQITFAEPDQDTVKLCIEHDHGCVRLYLSAEARPWEAIARWSLEVAKSASVDHSVEFYDKKFGCRLTARKMNRREQRCLRFSLMHWRRHQAATNAGTTKEVFKAREDYGRFLHRLMPELLRFTDNPEEVYLRRHADGDSCDGDPITQFVRYMAGLIID